MYRNSIRQVAIIGLVALTVALVYPSVCKEKPVTPLAVKHKPRTYTVDQLKGYAKKWLNKSDISFECLDLLWTMESDWNYKSQGYLTYSGRALGIAQALPATKMKSISNNYKTNPLTQIKWGLSYIKARYSNNPCSALRHEFNEGWY